MEFTEQDLVNISTAIAAGGKVWENEILSDIKKRLKEFLRTQSNRCCYCRRSFAGEFNMVIDIEHVLPKGQFSEFMFRLFNLTIACKRCNMEIKNNDTTFITDIDAVREDAENTLLYRLLHPNFDTYDDHLEYNCVIKGNDALIKYLVKNGSGKGSFTYEYFKLANLELDCVQTAQGSVESAKLSTKISPEMIARLTQAISKL